MKALEEAAKKEGELTWYVAHYTSEGAEELGARLHQDYGIKVNVVRTTAQVAYQRADAGLQGQPDDLRRLLDDRHRPLVCASRPRASWRSTCRRTRQDRSRLPQPRSRRLLPHHLGRPRRADLQHHESEGRGRAQEVDRPARSQVEGQGLDRPSRLLGLCRHLGAEHEEAQYGWDYFEKLEKNKPQIGRSINDTVTALNAGERQVAAGADGSTLFSASRGNPLAIVYPTDGSMLIIAPSAIMKGTKHPNAAKLFMEYLYSVEASEIDVKHFAVPLRPEVPVARAPSRSTRSRFHPTDRGRDRQGHPRGDRAVARHVRQLIAVTQRASSLRASRGGGLAGPEGVMTQRLHCGLSTPPLAKTRAPPQLRWRETSHDRLRAALSTHGRAARVARLRSDVAAVDRARRGPDVPGGEPAVTG